MYAAYLAWCNGDESMVEGVGRADSALRDALRPELEVVEFAIRSRYHTTMLARCPGVVWLLDPATPVRAILERRDPTALRLLESGQRSVDEAVDRLEFGFWAQLTANRYEKALWVPHLHRAYGRGSDRKRVDVAISDIRRLRNAVHHYEVMLTVPLRQRMEQIFWLLDQLVPGLGEDRRGIAPVLTLLQGFDNGG
jgi:hypothetical protein